MENEKLRRLQRAIEKTKAEIVAIGDLRPGSISERYTVCGKPGCRCKARPPQKHGPYYHLSYTFRNKGGTRFVKKGDLSRIQREIKNHVWLKELVRRWVELAMELSELKSAGVKRATRK